MLQAEDGIRHLTVTGVQTCALPICGSARASSRHGTACRGACRARTPGSGNTGCRRPASLSVGDRKSTRLNSSHSQISYAVFCLKKKKKKKIINNLRMKHWTLHYSPV